MRRRKPSGAKHADFRRAAWQRLTAAECLLESGNRENYLDAMYLAGYVVECSLKAVILLRTPKTHRPETFERISQGVKGHNFDRLEGMVKKRGGRFPADVAQALRQVSRWSPEWRYRVGATDREDAASFLAAGRSIAEWMERSW